jgi:starch synthase
MKLLFAASEVAPFAKTGGLADVAGSLPRALADLGHEVRVVLPRYRQVDADHYGLRRIATFFVPLGSWKERCDILEGRLNRKVSALFVQKDIYYDRPELYGTLRGGAYADNAERFVFFCRAIPELCRSIGFLPDIIHCNDWQTGLVPLYLRRFVPPDEPLANARTVFTVHNLAYQGLFPASDLALTGLGPGDFTPQSIEFWGRLNFLKAGIVFADAVTTVSSTYSREIQTPEAGFGLDGVLRSRSADLYGILNGIDPDEWDPASDSAIAAPYAAARLSGKQACRKALLRELGLPAGKEPVIGMVTRLADQKGLDILVEALPEILALGTRLVILGSGDIRYHRLLEEQARNAPDRVRAILRYDDVLARRIYAGSDMFLMPSRYEPCGLGQMHALRYGAVPVVRRTGGLADTVTDYNERTGTGTGFVFDDYSPATLTACVARAAAVFRDRTAWNAVMQAGMRMDLSWKESAREYEKVYRKIARA